METLHAGYIRFGISQTMFSATVFVSLCFSKQLLDSVFVISVIINVSRFVFKHVPALAGNALSH